MTTTAPVPEAPEPVLSTMNPDGTRRTLRPKPSRGFFYTRRRVVAYALMLVFVLLPYLRLAGKPLILLDLPRREFTLFGTTFLPTETLLFMLLFLSTVILVFLVTALFGRAWCGWACPQTVYMEFLFRPMERLLEGGYGGSSKLDRTPGMHPRRWLKLAVYGLLSMFLAHTFLSYFVGVDRLWLWIHRSPVEHPTSFFIMLGTTLAMFLDFAWFREQTCLVACPYGRLQSALLDRDSVIVGYDRRRGEPRAHGLRDRPQGAGDCVECRLCVVTCPTGIDIREGLQMECIHCTQCADACDSMMLKLGKPRGLIRYTSRDEIEGKPRRLLRPRTLIYPLLLLGSVSALGWQLGTRATAEVTVLRGSGNPYTVGTDGRVANQVRLKITNRGPAAREYRVDLLGMSAGQLLAPINPVPVAGGKSETEGMFVFLPQSAFRHGELAVVFRVTDGRGFRQEVPYKLVAPEIESEVRK